MGEGLVRYSMDAGLQHLYRQYLEGQTLAAYMQYYLGTRRAGVVAECFSGRQCPHCALNKIKKRFPVTHEIHDSLLDFFSSFQLTDNSTYLRTVEVGSPGPDYWIPALLGIFADRYGHFFRRQNSDLSSNINYLFAMYQLK